MVCRSVSSAGISSRKRDGMLYCDAPQSVLARACTRYSLSMARVMPT